MDYVIAQPDDGHIHLRDGLALAHTVPHVARIFRRAVVMPNLNPPVTTLAEALAYRERILKAVPRGLDFEPLMTLYLTDHTDPQEVYRAKRSGQIHGIKLYPAGATTHSDRGVTDLEGMTGVLAMMERMDLPLLIHGEVVDPEVDVFDRERVFIERYLAPLTQRFPGLRLVLEHITTLEAVDFVRSAPKTMAATITAHHLLLNRNALFQGGLRPHHYCLPVLKREIHRQALIQAATSGDPKFFLGTDSAPHAQHRKETSCGCAGVYTAHAALELYAEVFDQQGHLDRLEGFASQYLADFYHLERNTASVALVPNAWQVPAQYALGESNLVPFRAGEAINWSVIKY